MTPKERAANYMKLKNGYKMKQTAVEWLFFEMKGTKWINADWEKRRLIIEQAKEMEKQQQGYSEEEVLELLQKALTHKDDGEIGSLLTAQGEIRPANFFSWFNRFKNTTQSVV